MVGVGHGRGDENCRDSKKWDGTQNVGLKESLGLSFQNHSANTVMISIGKKRHKSVRF